MLSSISINGIILQIVKLRVFFNLSKENDVTEDMIQYHILTALNSIRHEGVRKDLIPISNTEGKWKVEYDESTGLYNIMLTVGCFNRDEYETVRGLSQE